MAVAKDKLLSVIKKKKMEPERLMREEAMDPDKKAASSAHNLGHVCGHRCHMLKGRCCRIFFY